jgi:small-conductance mechanosensitive channel
MNVPVWAGWILVAVMAMVSGIIFIGKGSSLIAGYNTAGKQERSRYNEQLLGKVVGGGLGVVTVILALLVFFDGELPPALSWLIPWGILGTIAAIGILSNTVCAKR